MVFFAVIGFISFLYFFHIVFLDGDSRKPLKTAWDSIVSNEPPPSMSNFKGIVTAVFLAVVIIICVKLTGDEGIRKDEFAILLFVLFVGIANTIFRFIIILCGASVEKAHRWGIFLYLVLICLSVIYFEEIKFFMMQLVG
jgi:drug/metabolite transporter (DMT)-like permease